MGAHKFLTESACKAAHPHTSWCFSHCNGSQLGFTELLILLFLSFAIFVKRPHRKIRLC